MPLMPPTLPSGFLANGTSVADQVTAQQQQLRQKRQQQREINQTIGDGIPMGDYGDALKTY